MKTTTITFSDHELDIIDSVKGSDTRTRTGKLRHMIKSYPAMRDNIDILEERSKRLSEIEKAWQLLSEAVE